MTDRKVLAQRSGRELHGKPRLISIALAPFGAHAWSLTQVRGTRRVMMEVRRGLVSAVLSAAMLCGAATTLVGCPRAITPAEIDHNGTKTFYGRDAGQVVRATVAALRTLGYDVTVADVGSGKVKTAPKLVVVHAVGNSYGATALRDELAWSIDFVRASDGTVVRLTPRFFRNGQPLDNSQISADPLNKAFADLFREIDSNLPGGAPLNAPATKSTGAAKTASTAKPSKSSKYAKTAQ